MEHFRVDALCPLFIPKLGAMIFTKSLYKLSITQQAIVRDAGPAAGTIVLHGVIKALALKPGR